MAWLRGESLMNGVSVILTAPAAYPKTRDDFRLARVVDYLPKPFALTALLASVRSALPKMGQREPSHRMGMRTDSELFIG